MFQAQIHYPYVHGDLDVHGDLVAPLANQQILQQTQDNIAAIA